MKNLLKLTGVAALLFLGSSCSEDFLEREPSEFLTTDQIAEAAEVNPEVVRGTLTGIYSLMIETFTGGTTNHDDFGHKGYDIYGDMLSGDMALSQSVYGWYRADITEFVATTDFTRTRNYMPWRYYYRIIRSANTVIDALGGNDVVPELEENRYILGQAKAIRAHSYFYLTQYYTREYNPSAEILPLYDDLQDLNGPKVATSEVFNLIESDLNDAISLLDGFNRSEKVQINQDVAKGILAYVKGYTGDWQAVYDLTQEVISGGRYSIMTAEEVVRMRHDGPDTDPYGGGFNDLNTDGWMWGVDLTSDVGLALVSWWGQVDLFSYSYAAVGDHKAIDSGLFAQIPGDDVRRNQFLNNPADSRHLMPINKFYAPARQVMGQNPVVTDYVFLRVAEMYLLHAEAAAHLGRDAEAVAALEELLSKRLADASSYLSGLAGGDLLEEIYLQTRIELWGEGKSYLALKRFKETVVRGENHLSFVGVPIPYNDDRLTFEIPESELQNNPFIDSQND